MIKDVKIENSGAFEYIDDDGHRHKASFTLFMIKLAWYEGMNVEDLADGFGPGMGTMEGDWSGIRDSSPEAIAKMFERAVNMMLPTAGE